MIDRVDPLPPPEYHVILKATAAIGFSSMCEEKTASLLRTLAGAKRKSRFLEIGTGTGVSTCWILDGMDGGSKLTSLDLDPKVQAVARQSLARHPNVEFLTLDAANYIERLTEGDAFDFIFADSFPGKFFLRNELLAHLRHGGLYVVDDLLPQPSWPKNGHGEKVALLIRELESDPNLKVTTLDYASDILIATRV